MIDWEDIDFPPINLWNIPRYEHRINNSSRVDIPRS